MTWRSKMNKRILIYVLSVFCFFTLFTQNVFAGGGSEGFSKSQNSLQDFKKRFTEIKTDNDFNGNTAKGNDAWLYY